MKWVKTAIVETNKTVRYALRNNGTTVRLCVVLATITTCAAITAWLGVL
jgi:hypothetical protein